LIRDWSKVPGDVERELFWWNSVLGGPPNPI